MMMRLHADQRAVTIMASQASPRPETVRVRAYARRGRHGAIRVGAHDRSAPERDDAGAKGTERAYLHPSNVAKAQQKMQDYLTFFRQAAARDRERGVDNGWQFAIANLEHFLDGTGTPMMLSSEQVSRMPALIRAEELARQRFEGTFTAATRRTSLNELIKNLSDGKTIQFIDFYDTRTSLVNNRPGEYAAIGQSSVHSSGNFWATRNGDLIVIGGEVTRRLGVRDRSRQDEYFRDPYDFDAAQPGSFPAITLEHAGKARRFDTVSEPRRQKVVARVRIRSGARLELDGPPTWEPVR